MHKKLPLAIRELMSRAQVFFNCFEGKYEFFYRGAYVINLAFLLRTKRNTATVANASIIGDTVTVWIPESEHPSERVIHNVTVVTANDVWNYPGLGCGRLPEDQMTHGEGFAEWMQNFPGISYEDALFLIFNIWTQEDTGAKHFVLFATSPMLDIRSGLLQLEGQPSQSVSSTAIKLSRSVEIADMTYIFEILIWKEV